MSDYYINGSWNSSGEAYHIAMHGLLISPEERSHFGIIPEKGHDEKNLFELLRDLQINYWTDKTCSRKMGLSETANTIFLRYHRDQVNAKRWIIEGMARDQGWKNPFKKQFRSDKPKVLIWQRPETMKFEHWRNTKPTLTQQMIGMLQSSDITPILIGPKVYDSSCINLGDFWTDGFFQNGHNLCKQLWFQHDLFQNYNVQASIGMMSGGMDGAALFFGHKTIFIARESDAKPRMAKVASVVPGMNWLRVEYPDTGLDKLPQEKLSELHGFISFS